MAWDCEIKFGNEDGKYLFILLETLINNLESGRLVFLN